MHHAKNRGNKVIPLAICDRVRGNQTIVVEIDFEIRAKDTADGLLRRECVFHPQVFYDICGARLCTLQSQNMHALASTALYRRQCRPSPPSARTNYTVKYPRPCADSGPPVGGILPAALTGEREQPYIAFTRLFSSSRTTLYRTMATPAEITRLLNLSDQDDSAFAEVISEYFDDREPAHDLCSEDDFLDTGI